MTIPGQPSKADWEHIRKIVAMDELIPYDANDPGEGPYDPNDDEAVERFLAETKSVSPTPPARDQKIAKAP
jgi:hypothetical protein